jgi:hypothetical protein
VFLSNAKSRRAKLTAAKLAALGLDWAAALTSGIVKTVPVKVNKKYVTL